MKKSLISFLLLFFICVTVVIGVLYINSLRQVAELKRQGAPAPAQNTAADKQAQPQTAALPSTMAKPRSYAKTIALPKPKTTGTLAVEAAIAQRRTRREFADKPVTLSELSQTLWSAQGITEPKTGKRTAPSARETYPYTVYVVVRNVSGLEAGFYEYLPKDHALGNTGLKDASAVFNGSGVQEGAQKSPVAFVLAASYAKSAEKMKAGYLNSVYLEGGHIAQNMYLETESLGMGIVSMAGFDPKKVGDAMKIDPAETPVYVLPFGHRAPETEEAKE